jgi:3-oxoacyl-[acyl-carrier-protein] synthase-3
MSESREAPLGIDAAAYYLGENRHNIDHWGAQTAAAPDLVERLKKNGALYYHRADDMPVAEMSRRAVRRLFDRHDVDRWTIDLVVYAHTLPTSVPPPPLSAPHMIKAEFGLENALCFSIAQQNCLSMLMALRLIRNLMAVQSHLNNVLVVCCDRLLDEKKRNLFDKGMHSDSVSACLVKRHSAQTAIRSVIIHTDGRYHAGFDSNPELMRIANMNYAMVSTKVLEQAIGRSAIAKDDFDVLFSTNMSAALDQMVLKLLRLNPGVLFTKNIAAKGHTFCSDGVVGLVDLAETGARSWRNAIIYTTSSNGCFGAAAVTNLTA